MHVHGTCWALWTLPFRSATCDSRCLYSFCIAHGKGFSSPSFSNFRVSTPSNFTRCDTEASIGCHSCFLQIFQPCAWHPKTVGKRASFRIHIEGINTKEWAPRNSHVFTIRCRVLQIFRFPIIMKGSLEAKLPTIWTDQKSRGGKSQRREEKRREEKRRRKNKEERIKKKEQRRKNKEERRKNKEERRKKKEERRKKKEERRSENRKQKTENRKRKTENRKPETERVRRKKTQAREKVDKSQKHYVFPMFCGSGGSKSIGSLKRRVRSHLGRWEMKKCTPLCTKHMSNPLRRVRRQSVGALLDVQMSFRVAGARNSAPRQKWAKREGFVAVSKALASVGHLKRTRGTWVRRVRRSGRWFPKRGCILEHQIIKSSSLLRWFCVTGAASTSFDLAHFLVAGA